MPQIPPHHLIWASDGVWARLAQVALETYLLKKVRGGRPEPYYERAALWLLGLAKLKA